MIDIGHIDKTFNTRRQQVAACRDVSLHVDPGQIYGVIGYSGAGKSTLVRCINFLEIPDSGWVTIDGFGTIEAREGRLYYRDLQGKESRCTEKHLRQLRSSIGMIFQHFNLLDRSTVFDNVAYPLRYNKKSKKEIAQRVETLLELVDLADKRDAYPSELSGGQKQRVAIARALANNPRILLCDEATSALDPDATESVLNLLKQLNQELGLTIVLITHEMEVIKTLAHRVAVMGDGLVVEEGEVYEIFSRPQKPITRKFVGSSFGLPSLRQLIAQDHPLVGTNGSQKLVQLVFDRSSVGEDLIVETAKECDVKINIILADVELLAGEPLGIMAVAIKGDPDNVQKALEKLESCHVQIHFIHKEEAHA